MKNMKSKIETLKESINDGCLINIADLPKCIECVNCHVKTYPKVGEVHAIWQECDLDGKKIAKDSFCKLYEYNNKSTLLN